MATETPIDAMKERAALGEEINAKNTAQGEAGTKQSAPADNRMSAEQTVETLNKLVEDTSLPTIESSASRAQKTGNDYPIAPEDRTLANQNTTQMDIAAGHIAAARTALTTQATSDAALLSDPRYERDLKVLELAQSGKLAGITPSEFEQELHGEASEAAPSNAEEQVSEDMARLKDAENKNNAGATIK